METTASEAISALLQAAHKGTGVTLSHAIVAQETEDGEAPIYWVDGIGLYAELLLSSPRTNGARCRAAVGGDLFATSTSGALHSRVLRKGDHVLVALVDGTPNGHAVILCRVPVQDMVPATESAFRELTEKNLTRYVNADVFAPGESWHIELTDGSVFLRLTGDANLVINDPDGGSFAYSKASKAWQVKHGDGASLQVHAGGVTLKSPGAKSWIEVRDDGVSVVSAGTTKVFGGKGLFLNVSSKDALTVKAQGVGYGAGVPSACATTVFVGI